MRKVVSMFVFQERHAGREREEERESGTVGERRGEGMSEGVRERGRVG